jgi:hypothetical protein
MHNNFYEEVDKEGRAHWVNWMDARDMVTSTRLATRGGVGSLPLPLERKGDRIAWYQAGSPVRIIAILRASLEAQVPVGYEDDSGFHYGADASEWFFSI